MSGCSDSFDHLLPEFSRGALEPGDMEQVAEHLKTCGDCALQLRVIRRLEDEIIPEPPPWFYSTLPGKVTAQAHALRKKKSRLMVPAWAGGLAAAAVALLILLYPATAPRVHIQVSDYPYLETAEHFPMGLEEELFSVSGLDLSELDQALDLELVVDPDGDLITAGPIPLGAGYETMDAPTMGLFERLLDDMTPERVRKKVVS